MISIVAGSLASSVGDMLIPTTVKSKADLYVIGIRFGMTLTPPLVTVLLSAPKAVLEFIGPQYASSDIGLTDPFGRNSALGCGHASNIQVQ